MEGKREAVAAEIAALDAAIARAELVAARLARLVGDRERLGLRVKRTRPELARAEARLDALREERRALLGRLADG